MSAITDKFAMTVEISTANNTPRNTSICNRTDFRVILPRQPKFLQWQPICSMRMGRHDEG